MKILIKDADLSLPVPACPGWNLAQLLRHVGGAHRWAEEIVRTRARGPVSDAQANDVSGPDDADPAEIGAWLVGGARQLAETLLEAGPFAPVWTVTPGRNPQFWARRMMLDTAIHRCDAAEALDVPCTLAPTIARDGLDEWMEFSSLPQVFASDLARRDLLGPGRTLHFYATDAAEMTGAAEGSGDWFVDLTGDTSVWRRAHQRAAVSVRGPMTDLLLLIYGRRSPSGTEFQVEGDTALLDTWLERSGFWLRKNGPRG